MLGNRMGQCMIIQCCLSWKCLHLAVFVNAWVAWKLKNMKENPSKFLAIATKLVCLQMYVSISTHVNCGMICNVALIRKMVYIQYK